MYVDLIRFTMAIGLTILLESANCLGQQAWNMRKAAEYLDAGTQDWLDWSSSDRGNGTSCIACHTGIPYAMSRRQLGRAIGESGISDAEKNTIASVNQRVLHFENIDVYYDFSDEKTQQSRGTEAIQNALICATLDAQNGRAEISETTSQALANLWQSQQTSGENKGGWSWLDFRLEPWESAEAEFYGAAMAAVAIGIAPGDYGRQPQIQDQIAMMRQFLSHRFENQHLHNQMTMLLAASYMDGLMNDEQKDRLIESIFAKQNRDGGWSLNSLGTKTSDPHFSWKRKDGTDQSNDSDGYGTGYAVYILKRAGLTQDDQRLNKALSWLKSSQTEHGNWRGTSVNKHRDPATRAGQFMDHAATAFAALALLED